ncbi:MAG: hypothetical protein ACLS48_04945 [[Eubacterium] siraeum]
MNENDLTVCGDKKHKIYRCSGEGGKRMNTASFLNGNKLQRDTVLN